MMAESTTTAAPAAWGTGVRITPPKLVELSFSYERTDVPEGMGLEYILGLHRFSHLQLGVEFGAEITNVPDLTARALYRMVFTLDPDSPEAAEPVRAFQIIAARIAPLAMYPFVREALASTSQRGLMDTLVLPIQNVGGLWVPDEVEIPEVEDEAE